MSQPLWTITTTPSDEDVRFLDERLYEYNVARTGISDGLLLGISTHDQAGAFVAGLYGWTWGGCLFVDKLWVREDMRASGYGSALLQAAEQEAIRRGCFQSMLCTHSFQALAFYQRVGYNVVGTFEDYPRGHQQHFLQKQLEQRLP